MSFQFPYSSNADQPDFIPASELPQTFLMMTLSAVADLTLMHDRKITVIGWYRELVPGRSGVKLSPDGDMEGMPGTWTVYNDLDFIEAQANQEVPDTHLLLIECAYGRSAYAIKAKGQ